MRTRLLLLLASLPLLSGPLAAFTLTGRVLDSAMNPIPNMEVSAWSNAGAMQEFLAKTTCAADGTYSMNVAGGWSGAAPNLYVSARWRFLLRPAATYSDGNRGVTITGVVYAAGTTALQSVNTPPLMNHDPATDAVIDVNMLQALPQIGPTATSDDADLMRLRLNEAFDWYLAHKSAATMWSVSYELTAQLDTTSIVSYVSGADAKVNIAQVDVLGTGAGANMGWISDIYHETGHVIHFHVNGGSFPPVTTGPSHSSNSERDPVFAFQEGWPSYPAVLIDHSLANDGKYDSYQDFGMTKWRGDEVGPMMVPMATGRQGGLFESGEIVEGALGGVWFDLDSDYSFGTNFHTFVTRAPSTMWLFFRGFVTDNGGAGSAAAAKINQRLNEHGIVFGRAKFDVSGMGPFTSPAPPNIAPGNTGNFKKIADFAFLRGKVSTSIRAASKTDLGVAQTLDLKRVRINAGPAVAGLNLDPAATTYTGPLDDFTMPQTFLNFDSKMVEDGDWDLVARGQVVDLFIDAYQPDWTGDPTTTVDTNEKYLKTLGGWYDQDLTPATEMDGKVIIDNHAPTVTEFEPQ